MVAPVKKQEEGIPCHGEWLSYGYKSAEAHAKFDGNNDGVLSPAELNVLGRQNNIEGGLYQDGADEVISVLLIGVKLHSDIKSKYHDNDISQEKAARIFGKLDFDLQQKTIYKLKMESKEVVEALAKLNPNKLAELINNLDLAKATYVVLDIANQGNVLKALEKINPSHAQAIRTELGGDKIDINRKNNSREKRSVTRKPGPADEFPKYSPDVDF